jgi:hypothetical protein
MTDKKLDLYWREADVAVARKQLATAEGALLAWHTNKGTGGRFSTEPEVTYADDLVTSRSLLADPLTRTVLIVASMIIAPLAVVEGATVHNLMHRLHAYQHKIELVELPPGMYEMRTIAIAPMNSSSCPPGSRWCWKILDDR